MDPKVTIIVPNYNHAVFLQQRLDSVFNQTFLDFEVILLDDASTDGSKDLLQQYENHPKVSQIICNDTNSGSPFKQWQKGIALAKGDYIWIAESDDYCELTFLEHIIDSLKKGEDICYVQTCDVDEAGGNPKNRLFYTEEFKPNIWENDFSISGQKFNRKYLLIMNVIPNASAVVFKKDIVKDNFFDKSLLDMKMCGDWLFWLRLCNGNTIAFMSKPLNYFRTHRNISRAHNTLERRKLRLLEEAVLRNIIDKEQGLHSKVREGLLYKKWFGLHNVLDGFTQGFYQVMIGQTLKKTLFLNFIKYKFKTSFKF